METWIYFENVEISSFSGVLSNNELQMTSWSVLWYLLWFLSRRARSGGGQGAFGDQHPYKNDNKNPPRGGVRTFFEVEKGREKIFSAFEREDKTFY